MAKLRYIAHAADSLKHGSQLNPNASNYQYGGLIKPKKFANVKAINRDMLNANLNKHRSSSTHEQGSSRTNEG